MTGNTHRANCADAKRPGCRCSGCGGSLHGWQGWTSLAGDPPRIRDERRRQLEGTLETDRRSGNLSLNTNNRRIYLNLARLDVADHLWATDPRPKPDDRPASDVDTTDPTSESFDLGRLNVLAVSLMEETWPDISTDIDNLVRSDPAAREIKKRLANHAWCGLLVALIQLLERVNDAVDVLTGTARQFIKDNLSRHFTTGFPRAVTDAVIDIVVDRTWSALERVLEAHFPLLGADTLRALRMLAVFTCPSVERHPEVYRHAVEPLMDDAHKVVSEEVRTQVIVLFTEWWRRRGPEPVG
ncbi:hypothetical protein AB0I61_18450 [Polymorphospora rubra]|uniref:hypothetical protein n=1 Tax=Polymorphospora rubra TaxID=338584 RepID=UPI0033C6B6F1